MLKDKNSTIVINHKFTENGVTYLILTLYLEGADGCWYTHSIKIEQDKFVKETR